MFEPEWMLLLLVKEAKSPEVTRKSIIDPAKSENQAMKMGDI
jgi:hypothetical protein